MFVHVQNLHRSSSFLMPDSDDTIPGETLDLKSHLSGSLYYLLYCSSYPSFVNLGSS